jgi:hypothetical protein
VSGKFKGKSKEKVKFTAEQAMERQRGSRKYSCTLSLTSVLLKE